MARKIVAIGLCGVALHLLRDAPTLFQQPHGPGAAR
jgi:hypothetical protein